MSLCDNCSDYRENVILVIDKVSHETKGLCDKCYKGSEFFYVVWDSDTSDMEYNQWEVLLSEEKVCHIPDDAWDAISAVITEEERKVFAKFLRLRNLEEKAKAVEGAHRGLLR